MVIIYCCASIFEKGIKNKGWCADNSDEKPKKIQTLKSLFILAAVPIIRVFVILVIFLMAACTKEELDELFSKQEKDDE